VKAFKLLSGEPDRPYAERGIITRGDAYLVHAGFVSGTVGLGAAILG